MPNPYETADPWEVSTDKLLPEGNHVVDIQDAETGTSNNGNFQIVLKFGNADGTIRDWLTVTENTVGKVVQLANATGVPLPTDEDIEDGLKLKQSYVDKFFGKRVGIVIREEVDNRDVSKTRLRVQGYVEPGRVAKSDIPNGTNQFQAAAATKSDDDFPF